MSRKKTKSQKSGGFLDRLAQNITMKRIVDFSRDSTGKPDPYKAAGIAFGMGHTSSHEISTLAGYLGAEGAFDPEPSKTSAWSPVSDISFDSSDDDTPDYSWRDSYEIDYDTGIDPEDYETEKEYQEALEDTRFFSEEVFEDDDEEQDSVVDTIPLGQITFTIEKTPFEEESEKLKPEDYPNKRQYQAAYRLCEIKHDLCYYSSEKEKQTEIDRCKAILDDRDALAPRYLTPDGYFLYTQAVKENLDIPIPFEDEDEEVVTEFDELISDLAHHDPALAVQTWAWCVHTFYPYAHLAPDDKSLGNCLHFDLDDVSEEFKILFLQHLITDEQMLECILSTSVWTENLFSPLIIWLLTSGDTVTAQDLWNRYIAHPNTKSDDLCRCIDDLIAQCSNYDELETMELFQETIFSQLTTVDKPKVQRKIVKWKKKINGYIDEMERNNEKYSFSRRYAWRAAYQYNSQYDLDPTDYETEKEYNAALHNAMYAWSETCEDGSQYGISSYGIEPLDYRTQEDYNKTFERKSHADEKTWNADWKHRVAYQARLLHLNAADYATEKAYMEAANAALAKAEAIRQENIIKLENSRKAVTLPVHVESADIYCFCGVVFPGSDKIYHYLCKDTSLQIGDTVLVPVRNYESEATATVVSVGIYTETAAPYPVDEAAYIFKRSED